MTDGKLGVAIHGAGAVARAHAASWIKNPHSEIVSVSSRRKASAQRLVDELGLDCDTGDNLSDVLGDGRVHIVDVTGPNHVHAEHGIAAAEAGKHVFVEKPMALSLSDSRALRDAVGRAGVKSTVGFVLHWVPGVEILKSLLDTAAIGELFYAEVDYWHHIGPWHHAWESYSKKATGGSTMLLGGCHAVDLLCWLVGKKAVEVTAYSNNKKGDFEYDANVVAIVKFRDGTIGKTSTLFDCQMPYACNIDLIGTEGTLRDNRVWSKRLLKGQNDWATFPAVMPDSGDVHHHPFDAQMDHFVQCILENRQPECSVADAYHSHELCLAIDRSIEQGGRPVKLPLE